MFQGFYSILTLVAKLFPDKERYGYQMLEKMGWADGKGLGKHKSGSTSHVKIKKRKQNLGIYTKWVISQNIHISPTEEIES